MIKQTTVYVTFQKEGIHCFPEAATNPLYKDVAFLSSPHRHIFHFKVWIEVKHDNRDIEFLQFKRWLEQLYDVRVLSLQNKSCEMIANDLHEVIAEAHPGREIWIDVSEDGENGCFVQFKQLVK